MSVAYKVYPPVTFVFFWFLCTKLWASTAGQLRPSNQTLLNRRLLREVCASDRHKHKNQENKQMQQSKTKAAKQKKSSKQTKSPNSAPC